MTRAEVRTFIKSGVTALSLAYRFNSGRISEFNSGRSNDYPFLWLESLMAGGDFTEGTQMPVDEWDIKIHIAKKDSVDSKAEQYEAIIDECDLIAQKLKYQLNQVVSGYKTALISSITREPFIKKHADNTTGVILSFTLIVPDQTDVC